MISPTFVTAGRATFTVSNPTGRRYTYRVNRSEDGARFFASLLTGADNESAYTYLGMVDQATGDVRLTRASRLGDDAEPVRVLRWALRLTWAGATVPAGYAIQHAGKCGRCGRLLTVPESINTGLGPECAQRIAA